MYKPKKKKRPKYGESTLEAIKRMREAEVARLIENDNIGFKNILEDKNNKQGRRLGNE